MSVKFHADASSYILAKYSISLCNWLRSNGIDPKYVSEVTVQGQKITVVEMLSDASGRYILNDRRDNIVTKTNKYPLKYPVPTMAQKDYDQMIGRKV